MANVTGYRKCPCGVLMRPWPPAWEAEGDPAPALCYRCAQPEKAAALDVELAADRAAHDADMAEWAAARWCQRHQNHAEFCDC